MTTLVMGDGVPAAVRALVERAVEEAGARAGGAPGVAVAVGADDPALPRRLPAGPRVVVPALRGRAPTPFAAGLIGSADAVVALDPAEVPALAAAVRAPLVVTGIPRPAPVAQARGIDPGEDGGPLARLWAEEVGPLPADGPAVAWIGGPAPLAAAVDAWARGAAVVVLPGARPGDIMRRGGAMVCGTSLEALEATRLLLATPPLARQLARRGRQVAMELEPIGVVGARFAEALALAGGAA